MKLSRRSFVKLAGTAGLFAWAGGMAGCGNRLAVTQNTVAAGNIPPADKATVYFSKTIDSRHLIEIYKKISGNITGKVAIKLHTGEPNAPNILRPELVQPFQAQVPNSTIIEANVAYGGARSTTERHRKVIHAPKKSSVVLPHATSRGKVEPQVFANLFFTLEGKRHGPFANEKNRYVALMQCLAELYPYQILKEAGSHINSMHRLTLMKGASYLYFREPVELPNNLYIDKDFPDRVLVENERYYLACCGLYFEKVMFSG